MSRSLRAGLAARLSWLADDNPNKAYELTLEKVAVGTKRPGNRTKKTGVGVQTGRALASVVPGEWGGIDFLASDAMVAEYSPLDRAAWLKDDKDARTTGVKPWEEDSDRPNMRLALPLEGVMTRASKIGQGFEFEQVLFLNRAHLIAHHRPDDPPINSTEISDPGMGTGDWTAGLHSLTRVRPWLDDFCQSKSTSSADPSRPLYSALLNFTRSAGDNTGWGGAHFATAEAVLSAEAFGFAHPADDGNHRLGRPDVDGAADILQGGLHVTRTLFGDTERGVLYSPAEFVNRPWRSGAKGPFIQRVEWREDENATHGTRCGDAMGTKKWMSWSPFREYDPGAAKSDPGAAKQPTDQDDPGGPKRDPGGDKSGQPTFLKVPYEGAPRPSVTTPDEIESPSMYGHPVPNGPDAPGTTDWPEGGYSNDGPAYATFADEVDALWMDRYKFTERQFNQQPITGHGIWYAQYENATPAEGKHERWRPLKSRLEDLSLDDDGWITGRTAALGHGGIMFAPADVLLHELYTTINAPSSDQRNDFSLGVFSAASADGAHIADGEIGLGSLKPDKFGIVKGWRFKLDFSRLTDPDNPDLYLNQIDEEGATSTTGKFYVNGSEVVASSSLRNTLHYPPGQQVASLTAVTSFADNTCYAVYLGRARAAITTVTIRCRVTTAYTSAVGSWVEAAVYTGDPSLGAAGNLTRVGYTDTSATVNSTGQKSIAVTVSGVAAGDHLWAVLGGQSDSAVPQYRGCLADDLQSGQLLTFTGQPSATSSPTESLASETTVPPWLAIGW